ncbi:MAG: NifU family protein [Phycisphaerales bacterium]|nr:NifU family protein [Phycisphaerales bacterium]
MSHDTTQPQHKSELYRQVEEVIDLIRSTIQADGGDLELVAVHDDGLVQVRFHGACVGCPSCGMTLHMGIERILKERVPGVASVEAVN